MNKSIGKIVLAAVALSMVFAVFACVTPSAEADPAEVYDVWCNGMRFDSDNLVVNCGSGTATYDHATVTLTLTDATIDIGCTGTPGYGTPGIFTLDNLKIVVDGDNVINISGGRGIDSYHGTTTTAWITVIGYGADDSSLTINVADGPYSNAIWADGLTVKDVTLFTNGQSDIVIGGGLSAWDCVMAVNARAGLYAILVHDLDNVMLDGSVLVGNRFPISGSLPCIFLPGTGDYDLLNGSMIIAYDPDMGPFYAGTSTMIYNDPSAGSAVWALDGGVSGITYSNGALSGFVPASDVTVIELYNVWCNGQRFASNNLTIACGSGTAVYDPTGGHMSAGQITLTDAYISNGCTIPGLSSVIGYPGIYASQTEELDIVVFGDTVIDVSDGAAIDSRISAGFIGNTQFSIIGGSLSYTSSSLTIYTPEYGVSAAILKFSYITTYIHSGKYAIVAPIGLTFAHSVTVVDSVWTGGGIFTKDYTLIYNSVVVGNKQPVSGLLSTQSLFVFLPPGPVYEREYDGFVITYDPAQAPFLEGTSTSIVTEPSTGSAVWALVGGESGITYLNGTLSGFVRIPGVVRAVSSITVSGDSGATSITSPGGTLQMYAYVQPDDADDKTVTWSVIGTGVATISATGLLTAIGDGTATVRATANDGSGVYGELAVTISGQGGVTNVMVSSVSVTGDGGAATVLEGGTLQMYADVLPEDATDKSVTWSVTDGTGSATISSSGLLTAVNGGTVVVRATANDGSDAYGELEIEILTRTIPTDVLANAVIVTGDGGATAINGSGGKLQMFAEVLPEDAADKTVTWTVIKGTGDATITSSGLLTAVADGTVTVRATANDGSGAYGETEMTISGQVLPKDIGPEGKGRHWDLALIAFIASACFLFFLILLARKKKKDGEQ